MTYKNLIYTLLLFAAIAGCRKSDYTISSSNDVTISDNGNGTGDVTWTADKAYTLEGRVFVNDGQTLTIEAGTVIHAKTGQGENASALIVARGGKIMAKGTAENPIIFTVEGDDLKGSVPVAVQGLWGGIIILGNAPINTSAGEGLVEGLPLSEPRAIYGGAISDDNSGVLEYVSIRHGGTNIGDGNEINGLTLAGVGSGTSINYVEVISNADDGFEFFGGTVNATHLVSAFCGDDAFDFDLGYNGKLQFLLAIQAGHRGDSFAEHGGGTDPVTGTPYTVPQICNATFIGRGLDDDQHTVTFSNNAGGVYANCLFFNQAKGISMQFVENSDDSYSQWVQGNITFDKCSFYNVADNTDFGTFTIAAGNGVSTATQSQAFANYFDTAGNTIAPIDLSADHEAMLYKIKPTISDTDVAPCPSDWFAQYGYRGAFGATNWLKGWSLLSTDGLIVE